MYAATSESIVFELQQQLTATSRNHCKWCASVQLPEQFEAAALTHSEKPLRTVDEMQPRICPWDLLGGNISWGQIQNEISSIDEVWDGVAQLVEPLCCQLCISIVYGVPAYKASVKPAVLVRYGMV